MSDKYLDHNLHRLTVRAIQPGLSRTKRLLRFLGNPDHLSPIIQVAGTNGKGSVCALLRSVLSAAGYCVGGFISPHLKDERERITINNQMVSRRLWAAGVKKLLPGLKQMRQEGHPATTFEAWTVLAAEIFQQAKVDLAVVEAGMGGRWDATSAWQNVLLSLVTNIELDHTEILGSSKDLICQEKAAIARPRVAFLSAEPSSHLRRIMIRVCRQTGSPIAFAGWKPKDAVQVQASRLTSQGLQVQLQREGLAWQTLRVPWRAPYQILNVALAALALEHLKPLGYFLPQPAWRKGFQTVAWPGRMEYLSQKPKVILDGAHNPAGVRALLQAWPRNSQKLMLVTGVLADKDVAGICREFSRRVQQAWTVTAPDQRALPAEKLAEQLRAYGVLAQAMPSFSQAMLKALLAVGPRGTVLVAGSLYNIEPARKAFKSWQAGQGKKG